jgi:hypothetical protein
VVVEKGAHGKGELGRREGRRTAESHEFVK